GPRVAGAGAHVDVAAPFLVVDAVRIRLRGRHPYVGEELPEMSDVAGDIDGSGRDGHHGGGVRVSGPPPPLAVLPAHCGRQPGPPAELVDGAGFAVVGSDFHTPSTVRTNWGQPTVSPRVGLLL